MCSHYVAAAGVPSSTPYDATSVCNAALMMLTKVVGLNEMLENDQKIGIKIALHTGSANFGVIGYV